MKEKSNLASLLALAAILVIFIAVESKGLYHYDNSDENVYFYMSYLVSEGSLPYRDFFYAHPPLELLAGAAVFSMAGFSIFMLKLIPLASMAAVAVIVFLVARHYFSDSAALLSAAFFLFTYRVMLESTYFLGINMALMFLMLGFYFLSRKPSLAGVFFAIAGLTRLLALVPAVIMLGFLLLKNFRHFSKAILSFLSVFLSANIILYLLSPDFVVSVYEFHLLKPAADAANAGVFINFFSQNFILVLCAALSIFFWNRRLLLFAAIPAFYLLFLSQLNKVFDFYLLMAIPFIAIMAGVNVDALLKKLNYRKVAIAAVILVFMASSGYTAIRLWSFDFADFRTGQEIADFVRANSGAGDVIYGDVGSVPLVSLLSGRRIMGNLVDTNELVYLSGVRSLDMELESVKAKKPKFVIVRPLYGIGGLEKASLFLQAHCSFVRDFKDDYWADFLVYDCSK